MKSRQLGCIHYDVTEEYYTQLFFKPGVKLYYFLVHPDYRSIYINRLILGHEILDYGVFLIVWSLDRLFFLRFKALWSSSRQMESVYIILFDSLGVELLSFFATFFYIRSKFHRRCHSLPIFHTGDLEFCWKHVECQTIETHLTAVFGT